MTSDPLGRPHWRYTAHRSATARGTYSGYAPCHCRHCPRGHSPARTRCLLPNNVQSADLYKIGCPAVDTAAGGGTVVNKVTVAGLKKLSQSGKLDPEPQRWVDATISLLESDDPKNPPGDAKQLIIDGCAKHGYPLQNLK